MEENEVDHDNCYQRGSDFLANSNTAEVETSGQAFQHPACIEIMESAFGQDVPQAVLPISLPAPEGASPSPNAQVQIPQPLPFPAEELQLVNQSGHSLYELQSSEGSNTHMMIFASQSENGQVFHVIPSTQPGLAQVIIPQGQLLDVTSSWDVSEEKNGNENFQAVTVAAVADSTSNCILQPQPSLTLLKKATSRIVEEAFPVSPQPLPSNIPTWARRLRNCEKIGDSYRGYCSSEAELESVLTLHKQQTQSVWGTRQSPSPAKPATRLMWKSQYVPFDGIPFVNAGSRAIVMECQYGPRRKGFQPKRTSEPESTPCPTYKATCPARIYIKKVQKFPEYRVPTDPKIDKKIIRMEQEKAFNMLKKNLIDAGGVLRWYVQLPTQQAHQYHEMEEICLPPSPFSMPSPEDEEEEDAVRDENCTLPSRLHPQVADKIRELVSQGTEQVYAVRKQLRKFVEQELFKPEEVPEKHNLSFFPTVNDIKNHIHEVQKTLRNGKILCNSETIPAVLQWTTDSGNTLTETVTVTFASPSSEGGLPERTIIKVESNQAGELLRAKTPPLLSSFQPRVLAQLKLQTALPSTPGAATLLTMECHPPPPPPPPPASAAFPHSPGKQIRSQPILSQEGLQASFRQTQDLAAMSVLGEHAVLDQGVVTVDQLVAVGNTEFAETVKDDQSLLGDVQTIPAQIGDNYLGLKNPEAAVCIGNIHQEKQVLTSERERFRDMQASPMLESTKTVENSE